MTPHWTAWHSALGEQPGHLAWTFVEASLAQELRETDQLDWKSELPNKQNEKSQEEFAKDVAAMANTGGGVIVYGIQEERGQGTAKTLTPVDVSEPARRRLHQLIQHRTRPVVTGVTIEPLTEADDANGILTVVVPASPLAPHFVGTDNHLGVPYREGAETHWMREDHIEREYFDRFTRRGNDEARLVKQAEEFTQHLAPDPDAWLIATAVPATKRPSGARPVTREEFTELIFSAMGISNQISPSGGWDRVVAMDKVEDAKHNPSVGLRRWVARDRWDRENPGRSYYVGIELHQDGAVTLAVSFRLGADQDDETRYRLKCSLVEDFAVDFIALTEALARYRGESLPIHHRLDIVRSKPTKPIEAVAHHRFPGGGIAAGKAQPPMGSHPVQVFVPVTGARLTATSTDSLRDAARDLAEDVLHQFSVQLLTHLR